MLLFCIFRFHYLGIYHEFLRIDLLALPYLDFLFKNRLLCHRLLLRGGLSDDILRHCRCRRYDRGDIGPDRSDSNRRHIDDLTVVVMSDFLFVVVAAEEFGELTHLFSPLGLSCLLELLSYQLEDDWKEHEK